MLRGLHKLCDKSQWNETISTLNQSTPSEASKHGGSGGWTALHLACRRDPPISVIKSFIERAPDCLTSMDNSGRYPIHIAAEKGCSIQVMRMMIDNFEDSIIIRDIEGYTPSHICLYNCNPENCNKRQTPSVEELALLLGLDESNNNKDASAIKDQMGNSPLHVACSNIDSMSYTIISMLVSSNEDMLNSQNNEGRTPLHLAFLNCLDEPTPSKIVKLLLPEKHMTEICKSQDSYGFLPLHCACRNFASFKVLQFLLSVYPEAASIPGYVLSSNPSSSSNEEEELYPIDFLEKTRLMITNPSEDEVDEMNFKSDLLFSSFPNLMPYRVQKDRLERLSQLIVYEATTEEFLSRNAKTVWIFLCTCHEDRSSPDLLCSIVKEIIGSLDYNCAHKLAHIKVNIDNKTSSLVMDIATDACANILKPFSLFIDRFEFDYNIDDGKKYDLNKILLHRGETCLVLKGVEYSKETKKDIAIKFERNHDKFLQRLTYHSEVSTGISIPGIIPILSSFDLDRIDTPNETFEDKAFQSSLESTHIFSFFPPDLQIHSYRCATIMPLGGKTLDENVKHGREYHGKSLGRSLGLEIGNTIKKVHSNNLIHRNLKIKEFLRVDGKLCLLSHGGTPYSEYLCGVSSHMSCSNIFKTGNLPPEMFAKLHLSHVIQFCQYWATVREDAKIADAFKLDPNLYDHISDRIVSYHGDTKLFNTWYQRIQSNSILWRKIKPRYGLDDDNNYFFSVIKCFKMDEKTKKPIKPHLLPYKLVKATSSLDIWNYGQIIFELITGNTLFHLCRSGDMFLEEDYLSMTKWDDENIFSSITEDLRILSDPVTCDFLNNILAPMEKRPSSLDDILDHIFFEEGDETGKNILMKSQRLNKHRKQIAQWKVKNKKQEKKKVHDWLLEKTTNVMLCSSTKVKIKFESSTSSQWSFLGQSIEFHRFPTGFVILPYLLDENTGNSLESDNEMAEIISSLFADIVFHASLVTQAEDTWTKRNHEDLINITSFVNEYTIPVSENSSGTIPLCHIVVEMAKIAEEHVASILSKFIKNSIPAAKKLVYDSIEEYVDLQLCVDIHNKGKEAESALCLLLDEVTPKNSKLLAQRLIEGRFNELSNSVFREGSDAEVAHVVFAIKSLVKDLSESPVSTLRQFFFQKVVELVHFYDTSDNLYFYFIDEYNGRPVPKSVNQINTTQKLDILMNLFPSLYISVRSNCSPDIALGVTKLVGLVTQDTDENNWLSMITKCDIDLHLFSLPLQIRELHITINSLRDVDEDTNISFLLQRDFAYLKLFIETKIQDGNYYGLQRICDNNNAILWTIVQEEKKMC